MSESGGKCKHVNIVILEEAESMHSHAIIDGVVMHTISDPEYTGAIQFSCCDCGKWGRFSKSGCPKWLRDRLGVALGKKDGERA